MVMNPVDRIQTVWIRIYRTVTTSKARGYVAYTYSVFERYVRTQSLKRKLF